MPELIQYIANSINNVVAYLRVQGPGVASCRIARTAQNILTGRVLRMVSGTVRAIRTIAMIGILGIIWTITSEESME